VRKRLRYALKDPNGTSTVPTATANQELTPFHAE
jgi:hypothetical protein